MDLNFGLVKAAHQSSCSSLTIVAIGLNGMAKFGETVEFRGKGYLTRAICVLHKHTLHKLAGCKLWQKVDGKNLEMLRKLRIG